MAADVSEGAEEVRAAEVIGALCLATDLGMGFPFEHGLHTTLIAPSPNGGWRVIELWESSEDAKRFVKERLLPAFEAAGAPAPPPPQLWPVHHYMP
jgi:hypothetical protein